jgi:hypothetical protein
MTAIVAGHATQLVHDRGPALVAGGEVLQPSSATR